MPRIARLVLPGVAVHVMQRGHNRNACFRENTDYFVYLMHLRELSADLNCEVHAYCLMTNHVHLLLTPADDQSLARFMRSLGQRYVQYFNRHHGRSGTLWEGRFRSCVTESARYVLACHRYIEMNPVRAQMVPRPENYQWSSHRGNIGTNVDRALAPHPEYLALGEHSDARFRTYRMLFLNENHADIEAIRRATNAGFPLVGDATKAQLRAQGIRVEPGRNGRPPNDEAVGR